MEFKFTENHVRLESISAADSQQRKNLFLSRLADLKQQAISLELLLIFDHRSPSYQFDRTALPKIDRVNGQAFVILTTMTS